MSVSKSVGVDSSQSMIDKAKEQFDKENVGNQYY